jgi:hypothetical protein
VFKSGVGPALLFYASLDVFRRYALPGVSTVAVTAPERTLKQLNKILDQMLFFVCIHAYKRRSMIAANSSLSKLCKNPACSTAANCSGVISSQAGSRVA